MVIYRFPPDSNEGDSSKKASDQQPGKMPDFIYVDDVSSQHENWESSGREAPLSGAFTNTSQAGYPLFLIIPCCYCIFFTRFSGPSCNISYPFV